MDVEHDSAFAANGMELRGRHLCASVFISRRWLPLHAVLDRRVFVLSCLWAAAIEPQRIAGEVKDDVLLIRAYGDVRDLVEVD